MMPPPQPVLLMALDDYFKNPSQDCLAHLFDAINSMDISKAPLLSRYEKLVMRTSERKDLFIEKFEEFLKRTPDSANATAKPALLANRQGHQKNDSGGSHSSFEDGVFARKRERAERRPGSSGTSLPQHNQPSPSEPDLSIDNSMVWVGDESGLDQVAGSGYVIGANGIPSVRGRSSTDVSSLSSAGQHLRREDSGVVLPTTNSHNTLKDTHFFPATMDYSDHQLPIRLPLSTFPEEIGDVKYFLTKCAYILLICFYSTP